MKLNLKAAKDHKDQTDSTNKMPIQRTISETLSRVRPLSETRIPEVTPTSGKDLPPYTQDMADNYAKINKLNLKSSKSMSTLIQHSKAQENLAYLNDDNDLDSPPVPESLYEKFPHSLISVALPPPQAFSDFDSEHRDQDGCYNDYSDIDKQGVNNNNVDAMSFYSDNYVKSATLQGYRDRRSSSPFPRTSSIYGDSFGTSRHSIYSTGSSVISVNSLEVSYPLFMYSSSSW